MFAFFEDLTRDIRFGMRNLRKSPGLAVMTAGSLALGIGATTAMYSVIYAVLLDPFPYKDVAHLVSPMLREPGRRGYRTYYTTDQYLEIAQRSTIFAGLTFSTINDILWTGNGEPQRLRGNHTTMNGFEVMGVPPLLGRVTNPGDAAGGAPPVAILSYRFWQRQFGGDPGVLGRQMTLDGTARTVIGVMPRRFMWRGPDVYIPIVPHRGEVVEGVHHAHVVGRLKPGVTAAQAEADLRPIMEDLQRQSPHDFPEKWRAGIIPFAEQFQSGLHDALWILFGAVGLLLLISCVNVSNLLLSKASARYKEIAVRASLGASRLRIVRQLLCESIVLACMGGLAGVILAKAGLAGIMAVVPPNTIPDEALIALNTPVLLFALAISAGAALIFGLAPALHLSGGDIVSPLKEAGRGSTGGKRQRFLRGALVVGEVALSLMLLVGASLMIRTLFAIEDLGLGMQPSRILTVRVPLSDKRYPDTARRNTFFRELLSRTSALPGVAAVGLNIGLHPFGSYMGDSVEVAGSAHPDKRSVQIHTVNEGYMKAVSIGLMDGRPIDEHDVANGSHNALVNEAFVRRYLSAHDALGRHVSIPFLLTPDFHLTDASFQIVGVTRDALNNVPEQQVMPEMFIPYTIIGRADELIVLAKGRPEGLMNAVRAQVYGIDKDQPVTDVKTIETMLNEWVYSGPRFNLLLFSIFAALGLVLALLGIYGVISSSVAQRTHEIGIRMALGASFSRVVWMVLGSGMRLVAAGVGAGLLLSLLSVRVLSRQVWKLSTFDPYSFAAVSVLVVAAGLVACFWPARAAARIDPMSALREE
ncbi:MAG TPA: ABC transporter permease [Bryobacteraceae bacterium]|nr:ABC transporter permease [Bryobacteraceae bacterium]